MKYGVTNSGFIIPIDDIEDCIFDNDYVTAFLPDRDENNKKTYDVGSYIIKKSNIFDTKKQAENYIKTKGVNKPCQNEQTKIK